MLHNKQSHMLYTEYISMKNTALHVVGNKLNQDNIILSKNGIRIDSNIEKILSNYFLPPFTSEEYYQLYHESDLVLNEVYTYVSKIFDEPEQLYEQSVNLAKHLYEQSTHPKIKGGEFYTVYFKDC